MPAIFSSELDVEKHVMTSQPPTLVEYMARPAMGKGKESMGDALCRIKASRE